MGIIAKLRQVDDLPTLPEIICKIQSIINKDTSNADMLARIIKRDPALSSTILRTANSIYYNTINRRISSIKDAVTRIGFNEVLNLSLAMSVIKKFPDKNCITEYRSFWRHSLTAANMTSAIADMILGSYSNEKRQDFIIAGLLHDIGILVYDQYFHEEFKKIVNHALNEEKTYLFAEKEIAHKEDHAKIGGALLELWKLPLTVITAVRYHHAPEKCPEKLRDFVSVLYLTEYILCNCCLGSFEGQFDDIDKRVLEFTGFSFDEIQKLYSRAREQAHKVEVLLPEGTEDKYAVHTDCFQLRTI